MRSRTSEQTPIVVQRRLRRPAAPPPDPDPTNPHRKERSLAPDRPRYPTATRRDAAPGGQPISAALQCHLELGVRERLCFSASVALLRNFWLAWRAVWPAGSRWLGRWWDGLLREGERRVGSGRGGASLPRDGGGGGWPVWSGRVGLGRWIGTLFNAIDPWEGRPQNGDDRRPVENDRGAKRRPYHRLPSVSLHLPSLKRASADMMMPHRRSPSVRKRGASPV